MRHGKADMDCSLRLSMQVDFRLDLAAYRRSP